MKMIKKNFVIQLLCNIADDTVTAGWEASVCRFCVFIATAADGRAAYTENKLFSALHVTTDH